MIDATAIAEAMHRAYPGRSPDCPKHQLLAALKEVP